MARSNTDGLRVYFEASGVDYFISAEVEQMIGAPMSKWIADMSVNSARAYRAGAAAT